MSSVNRVLQKRRKAQGQSLGYETATTEGNQLGANGYSPKNQSNQKSLYDDEKEKSFQQYAQLSQYNPQSFEFSNTHMPASLTLYNRYRGQLSCFVNPINQNLEYTPQSGNTIPRCSSCRSYMNYYNQATKKGYMCFLCGRQNGYDFQYTPSQELIERTSPSYMVDGPSGVYNAIPPQKTFIFLVDVSKQAFQCKMISYIVPVIKDVLSREDMGQTQIYFYTYDESVHQYDFSGDQVERTILDPSITNRNFRPIDCFLSQIKDKLFAFLDSLEDVAEKNTKQGSCFYQVFEYVYENIKHTGGKMFIFQANQAVIGEAFTNQNVKTAPNTQEAKLKSTLQTRNKALFNRFIQPMLQQNISSSIFVFGRTYKNIRVYADLCKLTNSELCYYSKDSPEDLMKFYYEFYYLLGATYYSDVRIELTISSGWYFTAVYGNLYRLKQYISFKFCHLQPSKKICVVYLPQQGASQLPYFSMQIITHYIYNRKQYMQVNTSVMPLTTNLGQLFDSCNHNILSSSIYKTYLSSIRLEQINSVKNKYLKQVASIWKAAHQYYKGALTSQFRNVVLGFLSFLKNYHTQIDLINDSLIFQRVISQRNFLQSFNYQDLATFFVPYLFDLTSIGNDRCLQGDSFMYPDLCELKFSSVKEGLFIMDCGLTLYLYISKSCHPNYLKCLFGKDKFVKGQVLNEEMISQQQNSFSTQVSNLIRVLRESKSYGWIPLYIVRCGQNSINEKNFYLNFVEEKYDQYKSNKMSYDQFVSMLSKQYF